jgi:predicted ATP-dependent endonuclease of OLD family
MIIKIRNFGAIKSCDIDLNKNLIAIFGENNIGKSYAISVVYLLFKNIFQDSYARYFNRTTILSDFFNDSLTTLANKVVQTKEKNVDITNDIKNIVKYHLEHALIFDITQAFIITFGKIDTIKNKFTNDKMYIELETNELTIHICFDKNEIKICDLNFKTKITVEVSELNKDNFTSKIINLTRHYAIIQFQQGYFIENYYLPASRSGLYQGLSGLSQIFAELSKNRNLLENKQVKLPNISEPISDYFITLSGIEIKEDVKEENPLFSIINRIEDNILGGKILFDQITKKINYVPNKLDLIIDASMTSSMVSEISSIVSFLKYIIAPLFQKEGFYLNNKEASESVNLFRKEIPILFIEEPEAHLHPKIQMELMEVFVELVNVGVKIIFTSHSDYMFNKMNNLILEKKLAVEKASVIVFHKTEEGGVAKEVSINELGADDENFIEAAEALYNEKIDLINKLNNENN